MRLVLLTTEMLHHCWFVQELLSFCPPALVLVEPAAPAPFATHHPFEDARDEHERAHWFGGSAPRIADLAPTVAVPSVNAAAAVRRIEGVRADVVVVFGTGRLAVETIDACGPQLVNLHGGDPQRYRGLDSHLWSVYHGDARGLITTLHRVNPRLDDGDLVGHAPVPVVAGMPLHELRSRNTEICVALVREAVRSLQATGQLDARPQARRGRYYSYMPAVLKQICVEKFDRLAARAASRTVAPMEVPA